MAKSNAQRQMLERLITQAEEQLTRQLDERQFEDYINRKLTVSE